MPRFMVLEEELEAKVAHLRAEGFDRNEIADMTADERRQAGRARGDAFAATQGRGKPMSYGHGSREKHLKETKG